MREVRPIGINPPPIPEAENFHLRRQVARLKAALGEKAYSQELAANRRDHKLCAERIKTIEAEKRAATDPLTGLLNSRGFELELGREHARLRRHPDATSVLLFGDLDGFKRVNDTYGHEVGNQMLVLVAQILTGSLRGEDIKARWGGDEFTVCLIDAGDQDVTPALRELYSEFSQASLLVRNPATGQDDILQPHISFGHAVIDGRTDVDSALREADAAMYEEKQAAKKDEA